jgi:hypothetical protein
MIIWAAKGAGAIELPGGRYPRYVMNRAVATPRACSTDRLSEGNREPCEPIPSRCLASTHVKGNAVNRRARKREKGSQPFDEENRDDFVVGYGATAKECGEDEFIFGRRPGLHVLDFSD